jgi:hypothetical protein
VGVSAGSDRTCRRGVEDSASGRRVREPTGVGRAIAESDQLVELLRLGKLSGTQQQEGAYPKRTL